MLLKFTKKTKIILYLPLLVFFLAGFFYFSLPAQAVDTGMPVLQIPDLNVKFSAKICEPNAQGQTICKISWIGEYIAAIYKYAIGIVGILAAVVLMVGGVLWIVAGGSATMIGEAKAWISASLTGLVIALCSYLILYQINPALTVFGPLGIAQVKKTETSVAGTRLCKRDISCKSGWESADEKFCEKALTEGTICCCIKPSIAWQYDPNIAAQNGDAAADLTALLSCLRGNLPAEAGRISSISDSNCIGNLNACKSYPACPTGAPACRQHAQNSCHYGGNLNDGKSHAVDLGDETNASAFQQALNICNIIGTGGFMINEGNHVHISTSQCAGQ